jgi:hypothetical protein
LTSLPDRDKKGHFIKGMKPWDKGISRLDMRGDNNPAKRPEVRDKISKSKIGKRKEPFSDEWKENISRSLEALFILEPERRQELGNRERGHAPTNTKPNSGSFKSGESRPHTLEQDEKIRLALVGKRYSFGEGEKNPNYIDGRSYLPENGYRGDDWDQVKELALKSADHKCFFLELGNCKGQIEVHHIIPFVISHDNSQDNLIVLCSSHHHKFERRWK